MVYTYVMAIHANWRNFMNEKRRPQGRDNDRRRADRFADRTPVEEVEGQLEGRNALTEALKSGRTIDKVFVAMGDTDKGLQRLAAQAKEAGAVVVPVDRRKLDQMSTTRSHQGIIALAAPSIKYSLPPAIRIRACSAWLPRQRKPVPWWFRWTAANWI